MLSILKASAGSGKTYQLTYEYIKLLLGRKNEKGEYRLNSSKNDRHRAILAITFTNKATDEMKRRIVHELAVLAGLEPGTSKKSPYLKDLTACFGCSPDLLRKEAARALRQLLFDFNFFNISTIDSFFQLILRTFAYEAELEGDYEVNLDTTNAIAAAADELFSSLNRDPDSQESKETARWITEYLLQRLRDGKPVALFNRSSNDFEDFVRIIAHLSDETFTRHFDEMMDYFQSGHIPALRRALVDAAGRSLADARRKSEDALTAINADPLPSGNFNANLVKALTKVASEGVLPSASSATIPSIASGEKMPYTGAAAKCFADGARAGQFNAVIEACRAVVEASATQTCIDAINRNLFVLGLFRGVYTRLEEARAADNVLLLSDTNALLRRIIGDSDAPFVFERIGVNLHHFLIDEFQDTSRLQWEILCPLVNDSQSYGHDNLIIGDEKQCIYRFRGSEPKLLQNDVAVDIRNGVRILGATPEENTNWRSSADVIQANNTLFHSVAQCYGFPDIYSNVCQNIAARNADRGGYVSIRRTEGSATEFREAALGRMLEEMWRQLEAGYNGSDIAVLVRSLADGARVVDTLMTAFADDPRFAGRGLRVISDDSMTIGSAPAVRRIIAVLRAMSTSRDRDESTDSGRGADNRFHSRADLTNLINHYEQQLGAGATPSEALAEAVSHSDEPVVPPLDLSELACISLPSLVERIVAHYFPDGTIPENQLVFIMAFEDAVADYCASNNADIQSFLRWWDASGKDSMVASSADINAVRVMTIHKSKGLEFPCVHLPLVSEELIKFKSPEWFEKKSIAGIDDSLLPPLLPLLPADWMKDSPFAARYTEMCRESLLDAINVLYVAFTRAVDELIVSYHFDMPKKDADRKVTERPSAGQLINNALQRAGLDDETLTWGAPTRPQQTAAAERRAIDPVGIVSMPDYRVDERDELWRDTRITTAADEQLGQRRGIVLHDILANVESRADLPKAVDTAVHCGALPRSERDEALAMLEEAMRATPEAARWFDPRARVLRERSIVMPDGSTLRPDRVVRTADGAIEVVDYKFGEQHLKKYTRQVSDYISALRRIGYPTVRGFLWYVPEHRVVPV